MTHAANVDRGREGVGLFSVRSPVLVICLLAWMATVSLDTHAVAQNSDADWPTYNRDLAGTRYSPLTDISPDTVSQLEEAWSYRFHPDDGFIEGPSPAELFQQVKVRPVENYPQLLRCSLGLDAPLRCLTR